MNEQIMYVLDDFPGPHAGTESQFWLLYRLMREGATPPRVVTLRPSEFLKREIPEHYECLNITSVISFSAIRKAFAFARRARLARVRLAHLFLNDTSVLLPAYLRLFGIKVIISRRDLGFWYTRQLLTLLRLNRKFVDVVIANCEAVAQVVQAQEQYPRDKITVILNGCEKPERIVPLDLRAQYNLPHESLLLGMVANLRPLKGVKDALWALATLKLLDVDARLFVAGADVVLEGVSQQAYLQSVAKDLGVGERVVFLGPVTSSWPLLASLDVFLSCSSSEGLSNSIIEAMSAGVPVVATAVGGTPSVLEHDKTGLLYPPGQVNELVACIMQYARNPLYCAHLAEEAQAFAENKLSAQALLQEHKRLYTSLLGIKDVPHTKPNPSFVAP